MTASSSKQPLLNKTLKQFMLAMVLANIAGNMYMPLLPLYLKELNANIVQVGLFFTLSQIIPLALQILGGWISDNLGRLRSIAIGSLAGLLTYLVFILAPSWEWLLLGEAIGSITRSLVAPSFGAFIAEQSSEENRARVYGVSETIYTVVMIIGPALGGWLAESYGFRWMLICAGVFYGAATVLRVGMARVAGRKEVNRAGKLALAGLRSNLTVMMTLILGGGLITWMLLTDGVRDIAFSMSFTLMPLYMQDIGQLGMKEIGLLSSISGIATMAMNMPGGWLADRKGERTAIVLGFLLNGIALVVFLSFSSFVGFVAAWILFGAGWGLMSPAYNSLTSKAIPENIRGTAFGLLQTSLGIFSLPAPAIGAQLWQRFTPQLPFIITAVVSFVSMVPVWLKFKLPNQGQVLTPQTDQQPSAVDI